jgi:hypothetical protein
MQVVPLDFMPLHHKKLSSSLAKKKKSARTGIVYDPYFQVGCPGNHGMEGIHFELMLPQVFVHVASAHIRRRLATPRADRAHTSTSIVLEGTPSAIAEVTKPLSANSDRWLLRKTKGGGSPRNVKICNVKAPNNNNAANRQEFLSERERSSNSVNMQLFESQPNRRPCRGRPPSLDQRSYKQVAGLTGCSAPCETRRSLLISGSKIANGPNLNQLHKIEIYLQRSLHSMNSYSMN